MITIVLLSHDNPEHLKRCLLFYKQTEFKGRILIADSSKRKECVREIVSSLRERFFAPLLLEYDNSVLFSKKIALACQEVVTEYMLLAGVDDFFFPSFIYEALWFLKTNQDYLFVYGKQYGFTFYRSQLHCYYTGYFDDLKTFNQEFCVDRLIAFFSKYSASFYAVFRAGELKKIALKTIQFSNNLVVYDNLLVMLALLTGKSKYIEKPFHVRELSENSFGFLLNESWFFSESSVDFYGLSAAFEDFFIENNVFFKENISQKSENLVKDFLKKRYDLTFKKSSIKQKIRYCLPEKIAYQMREKWFFLKNFFINSGSFAYLNNKKTSYSLEFEILKKLIKESEIVAYRKDVVFVKQI